jgi:hypothetical protein
MFKFIIPIVVIGFIFTHSENTFAQENHRALNLFAKFGDETRINAHYEIPITKSITISPSVAFPTDFESVEIGGRIDLYFDRLFRLHHRWDLWAGIDTGVIINAEDDFNLNAHAGLEFKLTKALGIIGEIGGGTASFGGIGLGIHF